MCCSSLFCLDHRRQKIARQKKGPVKSQRKRDKTRVKTLRELLQRLPPCLPACTAAPSACSPCVEVRARPSSSRLHVRALARLITPLFTQPFRAPPVVSSRQCAHDRPCAAHGLARSRFVQRRSPCAGKARCRREIALKDLVFRRESRLPTVRGSYIRSFFFRRTRALLGFCTWATSVRVTGPISHTSKRRLAANFLPSRCRTSTSTLRCLRRKHSSLMH